MTENYLHPAIPRIQCPRCGCIMRLAKSEPSPSERATDRLTFECACGFTYEQTERARTYGKLQETL